MADKDANSGLTSSSFIEKYKIFIIGGVVLIIIVIIIVIVVLSKKSTSDVSDTSDVDVDVDVSDTSDDEENNTATEEVTIQMEEVTKSLKDKEIAENTAKAVAIKIEQEKQIRLVAENAAKEAQIKKDKLAEEEALSKAAVSEANIKLLNAKIAEEEQKAKLEAAKIASIKNSTSAIYTQNIDKYTKLIQENDKNIETIKNKLKFIAEAVSILGSRVLITKQYTDPDLIKLVDLHTQLMNAMYAVNTNVGKVLSSTTKYKESKKKFDRLNKIMPNHNNMSKLHSKAKADMKRNEQDMKLAKNNLNDSKKLVDNLRSELKAKSETIKKEQQHYSAELSKIVKIRDENISNLNSWKIIRDKNILSLRSDNTSNIPQSTLVEGMYSV